jgi:MFS family permease
LALARIGVGGGEAFGLPSTQSVISDYFPKEKRTTAISVLLLAPPIGALLGSAGGGMIAQTWGWRTAFVIAAIPGFVLALLVLLTVAEPPRGQHDHLASAREEIPPFASVLKRMWRRHSFRHALAGSTIASLAGSGVFVFLAAFLARRFGFSIGEAALIAGFITSAPAMLGVVGAGWLADRMARRDARAYGNIPGWSLLLGAPVYILAVTRETAGAAIALLALAAFFQICYLGPSQGLFQNEMHPRMRATSTAVTTMIYSLVGGGLGPLMVGALSDYFATAEGEARGLSTALAITALLYFWAAAHFFRGTHRIREELALPL